jgi:cyanophycin synthetase
VLREQGVPSSAITLIPDEQEAIDHALRMGREGDLLLIFADALTRSWKQVIKFKPEGVMTRQKPVPAAAAIENTREATDEAGSAFTTGDDTALAAAGFVRDERGLRFVGEAAD